MVAWGFCVCVRVCWGGFFLCSSEWHFQVGLFFNAQYATLPPDESLLRVSLSLVALSLPSQFCKWQDLPDSSCFCLPPNLASATLQKPLVRPNGESVKEPNSGTRMGYGIKFPTMLLVMGKATSEMFRLDRARGFQGKCAYSQVIYTFSKSRHWSRSPHHALYCHTQLMHSDFTPAV